jgi:hypothetical protein
VNALRWPHASRFRSSGDAPFLSQENDEYVLELDEWQFRE